MSKRLLVVGFVALLGVACAPERASDSGSDEGGPCSPVRPYFTQTAWAEVFGKTCVNCHGPGGLASQQNAKLQLLPSTYPGFIDANLANLGEMARYEYDGEPVLILKPTAQIGHGGGQVIDPDGREAQIIRELVAQLDGAVACAASPIEDAYEEATILDTAATLRKATLHLAGRLPTADERQRVESAGDAGLAEALDGLMAEDAFLDRIRELFNDRLLTDRFLLYNGFAVNILNEALYPRAGEWWDELPADQRLKIGRAVAREPLDLIAWIVANDRPITEMLTADHMVFNPYSARLYDVDIDFTNPKDARELRPGRLTPVIDGEPVEVVHAGVLTSPMFLNRFPTSPTNRNRHRARIVYDLFLATDILRLAERPIDPTAATAYNNPTREDPDCTSCHRLIDPIAGAFQKFNDFDYEVFMPEREWHAEMFPAGYGREIMPRDEYQSAPAWMAARLVRDPRFVVSIVRTLYTGLTGREPLDYPVDVEAPGFRAELAAWRRQDATFSAIAGEMAGSDHNLKVAVRALVLSPWFRVANVEPDLDPERLQVVDALGTGRLVTPERMSERIEAVTGLRWTRGGDGADQLTTLYRIAYGGIDSDAVTTRLLTPSGVMASVMNRMANEVACLATAWDFTKPEDERLLFPLVSTHQVPETPDGSAIPAGTEAAKANIQHLHRHLLGEDLRLDDPEIQRTYDLFHETWREGMDAMMAGEEVPAMPWACRGRWDRLTGEELPEAEQINQDEVYAIRAWMAVVTYLLSDWGFLYE